MYSKSFTPVAGGFAAAPGLEAAGSTAPAILLVIAMLLAIFVALVNLGLVVRAIRSIIPREEA